MRRVHGEATECVVFMGRQRNASCSSGGNGTRGSQPAGSKRNALCSSRGLGRNRRCKRGLAYRRTGETALCSTGHVQNGVLLIGRGVAYRKTEETDLLRSKRGSCCSGGVWRTAKRTKRISYGRNGGPVHREGCGVPQNGTPWDTVHLHRRPPPASTGYRRPPPASTACYSTGYCSTTPPQAPLHRLLFIQPSTPRGPVQPPLHGHPSTVYCSSSPPHH